MVNLSRRSARILIADDDPAVRHSITEILTRRGFECSAVASATEALPALSTTAFDVIVADIGMPGNTGLELVQALAQGQGDMRRIPIVLVTGQPSLETAMLAVKLRVIGYLTKPIATDELTRLVESGAEAYNTSRLLREHRARLEQMVVAMRQLDEPDQPSDLGAADDTLCSYLRLSIEHMIITVTDIRSLVETIIAREGAAEAQQRLASTRPLLLLDAIRETISVLEHTKHSFKSRELAELRSKLERLLAIGSSRTQSQPG